MDTSALVRLYTNEPGRGKALSERETAGGVVAHLITYTETRAALAGRLRRKEMARRAYAQALTDFERDWNTFEHVTVDEALVRHAGDLAEKHALRGFDAVHLASAIALKPLGVRFLTFDRDLHATAVIELGSAVVTI